jgi:ABC-type uncharacterized transport system substrate-binding protein
LKEQNIIVERRYAHGQAERFQDFAREMVQLKAAVIVVVTTPASFAVMNATRKSHSSNVSISRSSMRNVPAHLVTRTNLSQSR